ncbi:unnamed protein product [Brachionus calyciflorus]|uniref:Annexin n=1 Tax=Brachionus calyciflorus TaxID=104777 RepID=A0A813Q8H6_9BILA|nr:unnamed protein product [Brachionus calyciflorus]
MNNYFNSGGYQGNPYPPYPGNGMPNYSGADSFPSYPSDNRPPYPTSNNNMPQYQVGFEGFNNNYGSSGPQYPSQFSNTPYGSSNYGGPNNPPYPAFNQNEGFPIAPSNSSLNNYPPYNQPNSQMLPNIPPAPVYTPSNPTYPNQYSPNYSNQPYQTSSSGSNLYPNLPQTNNYQPTPVSVSNPTLRPFQPFNPSHDAERLYKAMKGFGTDEATLIDVLCKRTYSQREEISLVYKTSYGKDLTKNIESETSGDFRRLLVTLLTRPLIVEANHLKESVSGMGTDENALIDVVCTKNNSEMMELKRIYLQMFRRNLEEDVKDDVSGYFKRFLVSLMAAHRSEAPPDYQKAAQQAKELHNAGENKFGTNEVTFNKIISCESHAQLRLVFDEYQRLTGHSIEQAIRSEMSTSIQRAFLTVIQIIRKPASYYAQRIYESMQGLGTRDKLLIRMVVLRSEIDMMDIKTEFQRMYRKSLESFIKSDCSGDYKRALLCLIGDPNWK